MNLKWNRLRKDEGNVHFWDIIFFCFWTFNWIYVQIGLSIFFKHFLYYFVHILCIPSFTYMKLIQYWTAWPLITICSELVITVNECYGRSYNQQGDPSLWKVKILIEKPPPLLDGTYIYRHPVMQYLHISCEMVSWLQAETNKFLKWKSML